MDEARRRPVEAEAGELDAVAAGGAVDDQPFEGGERRIGARGVENIVERRRLGGGGIRSVVDGEVGGDDAGEHASGEKRACDKAWPRPGDGDDGRARPTG